MNNPVYAAVQDGVILDIYDNKEDAVARVHEEIKRDWIIIICKSHLRRALKKAGNIAMHKYSVVTIIAEEEIK